MSSHIDHHTALQSRGSGALSHFSGPSEDLYEHAATRSADGKSYNFPVSQSGGLHATKHVSLFAPVTALPTIAPAASQLDIRIPAGSCGAVTGLAIRLDLQNQSMMSATSYTGIANLFDRIELWAEGGSQLVQRWCSDALRISNHFLSRTQAEIYDRQEGFGSMNYGQSKTLFLRLPWSIFESTHINVASLTADLYLRLYFRGAASYDGNEYLTLRGCQAVVTWMGYPSTIQRALTARARSSTLDYRFFSNQTQKEVLTLAPSTRYSVRLSSMQGIIIQIAMIIRQAGVTGMAYVVGGLKPSSYELLDSSGKSILGANVLPIWYNDFEKQQQGLLTSYNYSFPYLDNILLIPLSPDVRGCLTKGTVDGYYIANGYDQIAFTTPTSTQPGQYEVTVVWQVAERLRKDGGRLSVHSS